MSGGPMRKPPYPIVETAAMLSAARPGCSPPALIAAGNTRAVPIAQKATPTRIPGNDGIVRVAAVPRAAHAPAMRTARPRPIRAMTGVPAKRVDAMNTAKTA